MTSTNYAPQGPNGGTFDVVAYRADPTGSADSSTAVQAAMTAAQTFAASYGRATVKFPPGKYKLSSTVKVVGGNVTIDAYGAYIFAGSSNDLFRDYTTQDSSYTLNGIGLTVLGGTWDLKGQNWGSGSNSTLKQLGFSGFTFSNSSNITIRDVTVRNVYAFHAIDLNSCRDVVIENCRFEGFQNNFTWHADCARATTANIALTGNISIDGTTSAAGERILVKNQTTPKDNGIWIASASGWARAADMTSSAQFNNAAVQVVNGSTLAGKAFWQSAYNPTVNTTSIVWTDTSTGGGDVTYNNESRKYSEAIQIDCGPNTVPTINVAVRGCHMGPAIDGSALGGFGKLVGTHTPTSGGTFVTITPHYSGMRISDNYIDSPTDVGIQAGQWDASTISGNVIVTSANNDAIKLDSCVGTVVSGNTITQNGVGGVQETGSGTGASPAATADNAHGIRIASIASASTDCVVSGNRITGNASSSNGIQVQGTVRCKISDNHIYTVGLVGVYVSTASDDTSVTGNTIIGANRRGAPTLAKGTISISSSGNDRTFISGNMLRMFGDAGNETAAAITIEGATPSRTVIGVNDLGTDWGSGFGPYALNGNITVVFTQPILVQATATTTVGSTVTDIAGLSISLPPGDWRFESFVSIVNASATTISMTLPTGPTVSTIGFTIVQVVGSTSASSGGAGLGTTSSTATLGTAWTVKGTAVVTAAGTFKIQMTKSAAGTVTSQIGSYLLVASNSNT